MHGPHFFDGMEERQFTEGSWGLRRGEPPSTSLSKNSIAPGHPVESYWKIFDIDYTLFYMTLICSPLEPNIEPN